VFHHLGSDRPKQLDALQMEGVCKRYEMGNSPSGEAPLTLHEITMICWVIADGKASPTLPQRGLQRAIALISHVTYHYSTFTDSKVSLSSFYMICQKFT
jgi:hypothetical protein